MSATTDSSETVEIRSPYRPLPRSARKELADTVEIIDEIDSDDTGRHGGLIVAERPPEELLEQYELEVVREPTVEYETDSGEHVAIYTDPDAVEIDGRSATMSPAEAVMKAEDSDRFTRLNGSPEFVDGIEVADVATDAEPPLDPAEIPDRWEVEHHPQRGDQRMFMLICRPPESDTAIQSTITFTTPTSASVDNEKFTVIVTDKNADGPSKKHSQPLAERVRYDDMDDAIEFVRERVIEYPI